MLTKTVVHMGQKPILKRLDIGAINEKTVSQKQFKGILNFNGLQIS